MVSTKEPIFKPIPIQCRKCKDIIWSKREGEFVSCSCKAISVDQTRYYSRYIGDAGDFIDVEGTNGESLPN